MENRIHASKSLSIHTYRLLQRRNWALEPLFRSPPKRAEYRVRWFCYWSVLHHYEQLLVDALVLEYGKPQQYLRLSRAPDSIRQYNGDISRPPLTPKILKEIEELLLSAGQLTAENNAKMNYGLMI